MRELLQNINVIMQNITNLVDEDLEGKLRVCHEETRVNYQQNHWPGQWRPWEQAQNESQRSISVTVNKTTDLVDEDLKGELGASLEEASV